MARESRFDEDRTEEIEEGPSRRERSAKHNQKKKRVPRKNADEGPRARKQALRDRERMNEDWEDDVDDEDLELPGAAVDDDELDDDDDDEDEDVPEDVAAELWTADWDDDDDDDGDDDGDDVGGDWDEEESRWN